MKGRGLPGDVAKFRIEDIRCRIFDNQTLACGGRSKIESINGIGATKYIAERGIREWHGAKIAKIRFEVTAGSIEPDVHFELLRFCVCRHGKLEPVAHAFHVNSGSCVIGAENRTAICPPKSNCVIRVLTRNTTDSADASDLRPAKLVVKAGICSQTPMTPIEQSFRAKIDLRWRGFHTASKKTTRCN